LSLRSVSYQAIGNNRLQRAYFKRIRLEAVRDALLRSRPQDATVTGVAAEAGGFLHPGRFAGEYLALFGEHPADTLRHQPSAR
jgi:transcriptional regulator GlxA family with amidase domain